MGQVVPFRKQAGFVTLEEAAILYMLVGTVCTIAGVASAWYGFRLWFRI